MVLNIEIQGKIDSAGLWRHIQEYGVNETDLIDKTLVYGETDSYSAAKIVACCLNYAKNISIEMRDPSS